MKTVAQLLKLHHERLLEALASPPVLVEVETFPPEEQEDMSNWQTARANLDELRHQARADHARVLAALISDKAPVYELVKSTRNASEHVCIGRAKRNDIVINDSTISSLHASIEEVRGRYVLSDHNSSNGTFVNQRRIKAQQPHYLHNGDSVRLGNRMFYFLRGDRFMLLIATRVFDEQ